MLAGFGSAGAVLGWVAGVGWDMGVGWEMERALRAEGGVGLEGWLPIVFTVGGFGGVLIGVFLVLFFWFLFYLLR